MIFCGAKCDSCRRVFEMDYTSSKKEIIKKIRTEGWSVGQRTLCKDCRPNSEKNRYRKIDIQINLSKWLELKPEAYQRKRAATVRKIDNANLSQENSMALMEKIYRMDLYYKMETKMKEKD